MRNLHFVLLAWTFGSLALQANTAGSSLSVYDMPRLWPRHCQLRQELIGAIRRGDIQTMEATCRAALELMPADATWRYNLACALAYREKPDLALAELDKAIDAGFRDADAIAKDGDLARIAKEPRFAELVAKAKSLKGKPVDGQPILGPAVAPAGGSITLTKTNLVWNFDTGIFEARVKVGDPRRSLPDLAAGFSASSFARFSRTASGTCP